MKNKVKFLSIALTGCFLAGCTCYNTHVPGRHIDHGENPGGIDRFFCNLQYFRRCFSVFSQYQEQGLQQHLSFWGICDILFSSTTV